MRIKINPVCPMYIEAHRKDSNMLKEVIEFFLEEVILTLNTLLV